MIEFIVICRVLLIGLALYIAIRRQFIWLAIGTGLMLITTGTEAFHFDNDTAIDFIHMIFWLFVIIHLSINFKHREDMQAIRELIRKARDKK